MMKKIKFIPLVITFLASFAFIFAGCEQGPMEDAGESIDDAVEDVGDGIEDATN